MILLFMSQFQMLHKPAIRKKTVLNYIMLPENTIQGFSSSEVLKVSLPGKKPDIHVKMFLLN